MTQRRLTGAELTTLLRASDEPLGWRAICERAAAANGPLDALAIKNLRLLLRGLVRNGEISPLELVRRLSTNPARILKCPGGSLAEGSPADITIVDPDRIWTYDPAKGYSKSRNSPWAGLELQGRVVATLVDGWLVYHVDRGVLMP